MNYAQRIFANKSEGLGENCGTEKFPHWGVYYGKRVNPIVCKWCGKFMDQTGHFVEKKK